MTARQSIHRVRNTRQIRLVLVLLVSWLLVALSGASAEKNHVKLWVAATWADDVWPIVEPVLHERYPEITVAVTPGQGGADISALRTALVAGKGPDLFNANAAPSRMGLLAEAGLLMPLDRYYEEFNWDDAILPWAKRRTMFKGPQDTQLKVYGMPESVEFYAVYYKTSVFDKLGLSVPKTYQEFISALKTLKENGYIPLIGGFRDTYPRGWYISTFFEASAGSKKIENILYGDGKWTGGDVLKGAIEAQRMAKEGYLTPQSNSLGSDEAFQVWLINPKAGMIITGSWELQACLKSGCSFFAMPAITSGLKAGFIGGLGGGLAVSANAEDPAAAAKVLNVLFSEEVQRKITEQTGRLDPIKYDIHQWDLKPGTRAIAETVLDPKVDVGYNLSVVTPSAFVDKYYVATQALTLDKLTPQEYVSQLQMAWEQSKAK